MKYRIRQVLGPVVMDDTLYIAWKVFHSDGNHRVPNVNANTDGDFDFNLGNFENDWNDDNCLLAFCNWFVSLPMLCRESFVLQFFLGIFFPSTEHASDFV